MTDRVVPVVPVEPGRGFVTRGADAIIGARAAALADGAAPRKRLGFLFWLCVGWVVLNILAAILAGVLPLHSPTFQGNLINGSPSAAHWLGTDTLGRDIFSRIVFGARVSMIVGFAGMGIGLFLGGAPGMIAAYRRGRVDSLVNASSYVLLAFPALVAVIAVVTFWGHQLWKITIVVGVGSAPVIFRIVRASTLSYATRDFVTAAQTLGAKDRRILWKEILPNILPTVVSFSLIGVAGIIVLEGSLAFLGLSVTPATPSWGNMLNESRNGLNSIPGQSNPWLVIFPALAMFLFLLAINLAGDRLRQHFDIAEVKL
jgi:peptide/nickel transport system permease protein